MSSNSDSEDSKESKEDSKKSGDEESKDAELNNEDMDIDPEQVFSYARHGHFNKVNALFEKGMSPDSRDPYGNTVLIIAAQNNLKGIAKLALQYNAKINTANITGNTALHYCIKYGYLELGKYLLSKGAAAGARILSSLIVDNGPIACIL